MAKGYQKREKQGYDIMCVREYYNERGELSYCLHCNGKNPEYNPKDPKSRKYKVYVETYKVPSEIKGKKGLKDFCMDIQKEFKAEVLKRSAGLITATTKSEKKIRKFVDFATEWVEDILKYKKLSHNYYLACKDRLKVMEQFFGKLYLHEITAEIVKNFCKWLSERTYKKEVVTVKKSLLPVIKQLNLTLLKIALDTGLTLLHSKKPLK